MSREIIIPNIKIFMDSCNTQYLSKGKSDNIKSLIIQKLVGPYLKMKKNTFFIKEMTFFASGIITANIFSVKGLAKELTIADTVAEIIIVIICSFVIVKSFVSTFEDVYQVFKKYYNFKI